MCETTPGTPFPFLECENVRELGGYQGLDGKTVKRGVFYRGPALADIKHPQDVALFRSFGIQTILDFRSSAERTAAPDPVYEGTQQFAHSAMIGLDGAEINFDMKEIFAAGELGLQQMLSYVDTSYVQMPFQNPAYQKMFAILAQGDVPIYFHCTAGKDRTGVGAALILKCLGVSNEEILNDFLRTNNCRPNARAQITKMIQPMVGKDGAAQFIELIAGVKAENMELTLAELDKRYPNFDDYLFAECKLDATSLAKIRADYLV